jgi:hypothetical protein
MAVPCRGSAVVPVADPGGGAGVPAEAGHREGHRLNAAAIQLLQVTQLAAPGRTGRPARPAAPLDPRSDRRVSQGA